MDDPCQYCQLRPKRDEFLQGQKDAFLRNSISESLSHPIWQNSSAERDLLAAVVESSANGVFIWDKDCRCLYSNRIAERYIPGSHPPAGQWNLRDLLDHSASYIRGWIHGIEQVFETGQRLVKADTLSGPSCPVCVEFAFSPIRDSRGELFAVSLVCRDLTEQKKLEQELMEREAKYRDLYNQSPVCLYRTRIEDGKLLECNKALADLLGYSSVEECKARHYSAQHYVDPAQRKVLLEKLQKGKKVEGFEIQIRRVDGKSIWIEATAELYPEQGYLEGAMKDITVFKILTEMEKEILNRVLEGKSNKEIAKLLCRSVRTIEDHRAHIMRKLHAHNLVELALRAQTLAKPDNLKEQTEITSKNHAY
jgi:PAS domain S-box-containing protein